jgi:hypothetical protein
MNELCRVNHRSNVQCSSSAFESRAASMLLGSLVVSIPLEALPLSVEGSHPRRHLNRHRSPVHVGCCWATGWQSEGCFGFRCASNHEVRLKWRSRLGMHGIPQAPAGQTRRCLSDPQPALPPLSPHRHALPGQQQFNLGTILNPTDTAVEGRRQWDFYRADIAEGLGRRLSVHQSFVWRYSRMRLKKEIDVRQRWNLKIGTRGWVRYGFVEIVVG